MSSNAVPVYVSPQIANDFYTQRLQSSRLPPQTEHTIPTPRQRNLRSSILTLDALRNLLPFPLKHDPVLRLRQLVESPPVSTEEILKALLRDILLLDNPLLNSLFQSEQHMLRHTGLREHTRGRLRCAIHAAAFGEEEVRRTVASAVQVTPVH